MVRRRFSSTRSRRRHSRSSSSPNLDETDKENCPPDDTGFYSAPEDTDSADPLRTEDEDEEYERFDYREKARYYFSLNLNISSVDPFSAAYDFTELMQILVKASDEFEVNLICKILEISLTLFAKQVDNVKRTVFQMTEDCYRMSLAKPGRKGNISVNSTHEDRAGNMDVSLSQDSGYGSQSQSSSSLEVSMKSNQSRLSETLRHWGRRRGEFIADDNQISISFNDAKLDVVTRRKLLHKKFKGLAHGTMLDCEFDIHNLYESNYSDLVPSNLDTTPIIRMLRQRSGKDMAAEMRRLDFLMIDFEESTNNNNEDEHAPEEISNMEETVEGQNVSAQEDPLDLGCENEEPLAVDDLELENVQNDIQRAEEISNTNRLKVELRKRKGDHLGDNNKSKRRRGPLELLNETVVNLVSIEAMPPEVKRTRMDDTLEISNEAFLNYGSAQYYEEPELGERDVDMNGAVNASDLSEAEDFERASSPLFGENSILQVNKRGKFYNRVDMQKLIKKMDNLVIDELENAAAITFEELLLKSNLNIIGTTEDEAEENRSSQSVSIHMAFLATLHTASAEKVYIIETDDNSLKFTKIRPPEPDVSL